jgi:competence protein ComEC
MIDTGAKKALSDLAWLQLLGERQIHHLSWVTLTHLDEDHIGGLTRLAALIPIDCVSISDVEFQSHRGKKLQKSLFKMGMTIQTENHKIPCIPFPTLAPTTFSKKRNKNMTAIFVPLSSGGFYVSAGDASTEDEPRIGQWVAALSKQHPYDQDKNSQRILKISHHGSKTSTSLPFLMTIRPSEAWISVGLGNPYQHPSLEVLERLKRFKIPIRRTDRDGALRSVTHSALIHK